MKNIIKVASVVTLFASATVAWGAGEEIKWELLIREAAKEAKVYITTSHTGSFGGVRTMIPTTKFGFGSEGDAALALYLACDSKFSKWCSESGGEANLSMAGKQGAGGSLSQGGHYLRSFKLENGDHIELIYRAPTKDGGKSSLAIVFVDFDHFATSTE